MQSHTKTNQTNNQLHEIESLASKILYHKKLYYSGKSIISDTEYDFIEDKLKQLAPNHPVLNKVGYQILNQAKNKVTHDVPMLSLLKTYSQKDLLNFIQKYSCVAVHKFDGMAISLKYNNRGEMIIASTRGDGQTGENVTEHVYHILSIPKKLQSAVEFDDDCIIEIRGEIYFPNSEFAKYQDKFDSFRNAVPGTLSKKDIENSIPILNSFHFFPYDILVYQEQNKILNANDLNKFLALDFSYLNKLKLIGRLGFAFPQQAVTLMSQKFEENDLLEYINNSYNNARDYEIDGIVFRICDEKTWEFLGNTAHHPRGSLAFKKAGETAVTEILSIHESIGRSGKISFRAKLNPVFLSGATISYATLHNAEYIEQGAYSEGAQVEIIRSGEVIPAIVNLIHPGLKPYKLPTNCFCGFPLVRQGPDLVCLEKKLCPYKDQESLVYFASVLDMKGISDKIIAKMRDAGLLNEPADFYKITLADLLQIENLAQKSSENILNAIENTKKVSLSKFLTALGLKRGGLVKCQEVAKKFITLKRVLLLEIEDLTSDKGWAEKSAQDFVNSLQDKKYIIQNLLNYVEVLDDHSQLESLKNNSNPYYGKQVCITGTLSKPRDEIKFLLEKVGAKVVSSVSTNTHFLVCNESSSSSKYMSAKKLGIPILTELELLKDL